MTTKKQTDQREEGRTANIGFAQAGQQLNSALGNAIAHFLLY